MVFQKYPLTHYLTVKLAGRGNSIAKKGFFYGEYSVFPFFSFTSSAKVLPLILLSSQESKSKKLSTCCSNGSFFNSSKLFFNSIKPCFISVRELKRKV